jgi:hypothetical protein
MTEFMRHKIIYYFLTLLSILACSTSTWCIYFMAHIVNVTLYFIYTPNHYNKKPKQNMHMLVWTHDLTLTVGAPYHISKLASKGVAKNTKTPTDDWLFKI